MLSHSKYLRLCLALLEDLLPEEQQDSLIGDLLTRRQEIEKNGLLEVFPMLRAQDVTSWPILAGRRITARLIAKQAGILSGLSLFATVFNLLDPQTEVRQSASDGQAVVPDQTLAVLSGDAVAILIGERTALNLICHLCGVATEAMRLQAMLPPGMQLLDTRKTLPGLRKWQKAAVRHGGGHNHRLGLYDMALIKNNHIDAAGSIFAAVAAVRKKHPTLPVEVECRTIEEVRDALKESVDRILLDNMTPKTIASAIDLISQSVPVEVSGNLTAKTLQSLKKLNIDMVSVGGALTLSAPRVDMSLRVTLESI